MDAVGRRGRCVKPTAERTARRRVRLREARRLREPARRQPVHGRRVPRGGRARLRHQHRRQRARASVARPSSAARAARRRADAARHRRGDQEHGVPRHPRRRADRPRGRRAARRRRSASSTCRSRRRPQVGDSVGEILQAIGVDADRRARDDRGARAAQRRGEEGRRASPRRPSAACPARSSPSARTPRWPARSRTASLTLEKLEAMTAVCSVGLDMIAVPGDTDAETLAALIADEMAIGVINHKTTAVRRHPRARQGGRRARRLRRPLRRERHPAGAQHRASRAGSQRSAGRSRRRCTRCATDRRFVVSTFTPAHRGGSGTPLVCLHGFTDTWRTWELVLPGARAPTTTCWHRRCPATPAGRRLRTSSSRRVLADAVERAMDDAGFGLAHIVGNSLGGYVALQLAARGRAASVVALAPAGGWAPGDESFRETLGALHDDAGAAPSRRAPRRGDRRHDGGPAPRDAVHHHELRAHPARAARPPDASAPQPARRRARWSSTRCGTAGRSRPSAITCPVRVVWGTDDRLLPWPTAPRASATTGCRTPTGSSSTASATAPSSTSRSRRRS